MKQLGRLLVASLIVFGISHATAQDENNPWAIEIGINAVDVFPVGDVSDRVPAALRGDLFDEFFNVEDHWNILPSISRLAVSRYIGSGFTFTAAGSVNRINQLGDLRVDDLTYYAADGEVKYSFKNALNSSWIDPQLGIGGGYTWVDDIGFGTANALVGFKFWLSNSIGLNLQSTYKHSFEKSYGVKHFQHSAGIVFQFGGEKEPEEEVFPGRDGDGVPDHLDECPDVPGLPEFNGCPDSDGDGIPDHLDECPDVPGLAKFNGCPDTDGDGIPDHLDECPEEAGPKENNGCPWPDRDGDGVPDHLDECPDVPGTVANKGCPEVDEEVVRQLNEFSRVILFDVGKSTLRPESSETLRNIANVMKQYGNAKFHIEGHTDSTGSLALNNRLSEERAAAVKSYLESLGINANRLTSKGYGPSKPVATNNTAAGRQQNRRVEISLKK